jgi:hypothetical protein
MIYFDFYRKNKKHSFESATRARKPPSSSQSFLYPRRKASAIESAPVTLPVNARANQRRHCCCCDCRCCDYYSRHYETTPSPRAIVHFAPANPSYRGYSGRSFDFWPPAMPCPVSFSPASERRDKSECLRRRPFDPHRILALPDVDVARGLVSQLSFD